ncbi:MAG: tetratricopeptide repeat protein [Flavobacteriales bacterium]|nr:tetratricopeptide repeat protein [Flavobacteriales bacterium]
MDRATDTPATESHGVPQQADDKRAQVMAVFMDATQARLRGDLDKAVPLFEQCLKLDPTNDAAMFELAKIYHLQQRPEEAIALARKAQELDKNNIWYRFLLADLYDQNGRTDKAIEVYKDLLDKWPDRVEVRMQLAHMLARSGKVDEARKVFRELRTQMGPSEDLVMQEYGMLADAGQLQEAEKVLKDALADDPDNLNYMSVLAELYDELDRPDDALQLYQRVLQEDPDDSMTRISLAEHYYGQGQIDEAFDQLGLAFGDPDLDVDAKMQVMLSFFDMTGKQGSGTEEQERLLTRAYGLVDIMIKAHPESGKPLTMKGDFLLRDGQYREARDAFRSALVHEKDKYPIWAQVLQLDLQLNDHSGLKEDAAQAAELFPTNPEIYLYQGLGLSGAKEYDAAIEALITGRDLVVDNDPLLAQFWSSLGDVYNEAGKFAASDDAFDHALQLEPKNPTTLNNYAYYLSVRGERLEKAKEMSKRSNELAPGQASYEDTYAWVLFRNGEFADARSWMEKALEHGGANEGVILEHYGDVLYALGDQAGALEQWKKAKELGGASEAIDRKVSTGRPDAP